MNIGSEQSGSFAFKRNAVIDFQYLDTLLNSVSIVPCIFGRAEKLILRLLAALAATRKSAWSPAAGFSPFDCIAGSAVQNLLSFSQRLEAAMASRSGLAKESSS